jgi:hypothetical protein
MLWWIITLITIMSSIVVSLDTALVFDVEGITDLAPSTATLSYHIDSDDSILIFEMQSNCPTRYSISPAFGVVHNNQMCIVAVELVSSDMGSVCFLSTVPRDFFLEDQVILLIAEVHGITASTFTKSPVAEMAQRIKETEATEAQQRTLWPCTEPTTYTPTTSSITLRPRSVSRFG